MLWRLIQVQRQLFDFSFNCNFFFKIPKMPFYAVAKGRSSGIFLEWSACETQVKGFPGAKYKKFNSIVEAQDFIASNSNKAVSAQAKAVPSKRKLTKEPRSSLPSKVSENNTKRNLLTSLKPNVEGVRKKKQRTSATAESFGSDDDDDFDFSTIVEKQLDDIEARLKKSIKHVDSVIKKNSKVVGKKTKLLQPQDLKSDFQIDKDGYINVYTDGACSSNGRSGARAGLGVYWGEGSTLNLSEPVSGRATNNCGEIQAAVRAITQAIDNGIENLAINTDSKFLINAATKWMSGWKRNGWKLRSGEPVKNEIDFKELDRVQNNINIKWNYVEAHKGVHGNEMADQLAKAGASQYGQ